MGLLVRKLVSCMEELFFWGLRFEFFLVVVVLL